MSNGNGSIGNLPGGSNGATVPYGSFTSTGTGTNLPTDPLATPYFSVVNAIWPQLQNQQTFISPARNGMNRRTGALLQGWNHVEQSLELIFATPFHERVLRRWVGSFVPHILGESAVSRVITRFFWAIASAIDIWEPDYRIKQIYLMGDAIQQWSGGAPGLGIPLSSGTLDAADLLRLGHLIFRQEGVYRPRAHLGDFTPYTQKFSTLVGRGSNLWDQYPLGGA